MQEQAASFAQQMAQEQLRADSRMRTVQESMDALANQPRVPEARVPPTQGNEELRMHVDETAARILGQQSAQLGEFGRRMGGFANELVRNLQKHSGHLSGMLRHLTQAAQGNHSGDCSGKSTTTSSPTANRAGHCH